MPHPDWPGRGIRVQMPELEAVLKQLVGRLGLNFGAVDLIETPDGELVFLEVNPNGQWLWIERITGAPMCQAMARLLTGHSPGLRCGG